MAVSAEFLMLDEQAARARTEELLTGELTAGRAVQVALLNNPRVRAAMLSIGVSRADFVRAALFTNPTLALSLRLPDGGGLANFETALTQNIAELWLIPARKRVTQHELDRTVLDAARTAASIASRRAADRRGTGHSFTAGAGTDRRGECALLPRRATAGRREEHSTRS